MTRLRRMLMDFCWSWRRLLSENEGGEVHTVATLALDLGNAALNIIDICYAVLT